MEGEDAAEEGALLGPRSGLLLLTQYCQVEVVGRAALLLTACNRLTSRMQIQSWIKTDSPILRIQNFLIGMLKCGFYNSIRKSDYVKNHYE